MNNTVYVVTGLDLGWDCVCGVFKDVSLDELQKVFPEGEYVIHKQTVDSSLDSYRNEDE
jgi:hypothetical protein